MSRPGSNWWLNLKYSKLYKTISFKYRSEISDIKYREKTIMMRSSAKTKIEVIKDEKIPDFWYARIQYLEEFFL